MLVLSCHTSNLKPCNLFKQQLTSESAFYESQANLRFFNFAVMLKRPWHCEDRITIFYVKTSQRAGWIAADWVLMHSKLDPVLLSLMVMSLIRGRV